MLSSDLIDEAVSWRHHLHQNPELAYQEERTSAFVASRLSESGLSIRHGLAKTGIVGTLIRGTSRRTIAIRADMDALPIEEQTAIGHRSHKSGAMHACGHDGHVAMALAAARACSKIPDLDGIVHFVFQPAEENEGGADRMVRDGLFREFPCDAIFALHNWPSLPLGSYVAREGAMMAAFAVFEIAVTGRGCHAAMPHEGADPILAATQIASALHTITSRNIGPLSAGVVSVTQIHSGTTWNLIPTSCIIRGTTRWLEEDAGEVIERRVKDLACAVARGFGCNAEIKYERRYPATINDRDVARTVHMVAGASNLGLSPISAEPSMAAEDFAFMLREVPGCYLWLGASKSGDNPGLHSPYFDFNDLALPLGASLWVALVRHYLAPR
jgi:amidohydrolase